MKFAIPRRLLPRLTLAASALGLFAGSLHAESVSAPAVAASASPSTAAPAKATATGKSAQKSQPAAAQKASAAAAGLKGEVALGGDITRTRFLIGLDQQVEFQVFSLSNPNRVIVELPDVPLALPPEPEENISVGLVSSFRAGTSGPGKTRVVITVTRPVVVESAKLEKAKDGKGRRLALEIVPVEQTAKQVAKKPLPSLPFGLGASTIQPPLPSRAERPEVKAAKAFKPMIVIDPGHGGHDSGAEKNGTVEKDAVLAFSHALKAKLEASGRYRVLMTRDTDVFVELGERTAFAERNKANLFIAVHADYSDDNSRARGATIYSLRDSVANALQRSAKGEATESVLSKDEAEAVKKASVGDDLAVVKRMLSDLAGLDVGATKERTSQFSRTVIETMGASTEMRSEPDQQAAFRVLKTQQFPSVLIELAYVTNKEDAALLKSDVWRDKVSDSIMTAVDNYFGSQIARLPVYAP